MCTSQIPSKVTCPGIPQICLKSADTYLMRHLQYLIALYLLICKAVRS